MDITVMAIMGMAEIQITDIRFRKGVHKHKHKKEQEKADWQMIASTVLSMQISLPLKKPIQDFTRLILNLVILTHPVCSFIFILTIKKY